MRGRMRSCEYQGGELPYAHAKRADRNVDVPVLGSGFRHRYSGKKYCREFDAEQKW